MKVVGLGFKRPATLTFKIVDKVLMMMGDIDIGLRPATFPTITQLEMLACWVSIFILGLFTKLLIVVKEIITVMMMEEVN